MQNSKLKIKSYKSKFKIIAKRYLNFDFCALHFEFRRGFTLLETIVALSVIVAAVVGPVSLITRGIFNFSFAKNKTVATNLAQEGMELVRLVRENNIICDALNGPAVWEWNRDPEGGTLTVTTREVDATSFVTIECGVAQISTPRLPIFSGQPIRIDTSTGIYTYSGDQETTFTRRIDIGLPPDSPDGDIPSSDQMDIVVTVEWRERGLTRDVVLRERLYNWR